MRIGFMMTADCEATDFTIDGVSCTKEDIEKLANQYGTPVTITIPKKDEELTE